LADMQVIKKQMISVVAIHSSTFRLSGRFQATTWMRQGGDPNPIDIFIIVAFGTDETRTERPHYEGDRIFTQPPSTPELDPALPCGMSMEQSSCVYTLLRFVRELL
jgi:hypothetical protein